MNFLAQVESQQPFYQAYLGWLIAGLIATSGLFVYGLRDTLRFVSGGFVRAWAISGVCFQDAIRRKVMILPFVAMLGIVLVSQLQHPLDQQDAIRLDIKFCFFTTALLVTVTTIILAATNLPREIDNRVIFTIVTKPVTRLEIVIGKVMGFARVSGAILLAMFAFSLVYLHLRAANFNRQIAGELERTELDASSRAWLEHLRGEGLLNARDVGYTSQFQIYARVPGGDGEPRWMFGTSQQAYVSMPFRAEDLRPVGAPEAQPGQGGVIISANIAYEKSFKSPEETTATENAPPTVAVEILDPFGRPYLSANEMNTASLPLPDPSGKTPLNIILDPERALKLGTLPDGFMIQITGLQNNFIYGLRKSPVTVMVPDVTAGVNRAVPVRAGKAEQIFFRGVEGKFGQQLRGPLNGQAPIGIYQFRNVQDVDKSQATVPFEVTVGIEGDGDEADADEATVMSFRVYNRSTKTMSPRIPIYPENARASYFQVPAEFVSENFDVLMTNESFGRVVGIESPSVSLIASREPFWLNLLKGLAVLWFFSILVTTIAVCCSTKLSWPISIVLTLLVLLARWGVVQLDDSLQTGIGAVIVTDLGVSSAPVARTVSGSVEALTKMLRAVAEVLPDISRFAVTEQIENGLNLSMADVFAPLKVLLLFGLPLLTVAYVFLRNKEVAP